MQLLSLLSLLVLLPKLAWSAGGPERAFFSPSARPRPHLHRLDRRPHFPQHALLRHSRLLGARGRGARVLRKPLFGLSAVISPPTAPPRAPPTSPPETPTMEDLRLADKRDGTFLVSPTTAKAHLRAWQLEPVADWVLDENKIMLGWADTVEFPYVREWSFNQYSDRLILGTFVDGSLKAMLQVRIETADYWTACKTFKLEHLLVSPDSYPVAAIPTLKEIKRWSDSFRWPIDFSLIEKVYGGMLANLKDMGLVGKDDSFNYWLEQCGECN